MKIYSRISIELNTVIMDIEFYNTIDNFMDNVIVNTSAAK